MEIKDAVVLVTGANRGIGLAFVEEAKRRGARKVYAAMRKPESGQIAGASAIKLDVTSDEDVAAAANVAADVTLVINNAGIGEPGKFLDADAMDRTRRYMDTNFYGILRMSAAFAPILKANGGGGVINVLSVASWVSAPMLSVYAASKAAAWGLTNAMRRELAEQNTQVTALHMGFVDTDLTQFIDVPKATPLAIVCAAFDGFENGDEEVCADERSQMVKSGLSKTPAIYITGAPPVTPAR
jgi:NAD(P)-dependent dehydrogenase (short-subunit alcohol dehydrogenase family)